MLFRVHPNYADMVAEAFRRSGVAFTAREEVRYDTGAPWVLLQATEEGRANYLFLGELRDIPHNLVVSLEEVERDALPADARLFPSWYAAFQERGPTGSLDRSLRPGIRRSANIVHVPGYGYALRGSVTHNSDSGFHDYPQYLAVSGWR